MGLGRHLRAMADSSNPASFANRLRRERFRQLDALFLGLPRPIRLLDVGGTRVFWENRGLAGDPDFEITSLNLEAEPVAHDNMTSVAGDGCDLSRWTDGAFDVVFSNSVIEHLYTLERQARMAAEIRRVGRRYWVQTPAWEFPIEPHFLAPAWHWAPRALRIGVIRRFRVGWQGPYPERARAEAAIDEIRLLKKHEMQQIFPDGEVRAERFAGLVKSWIAVRQVG
jgi:hypothetical protein